MILLDTNIISELMRPSPQASVAHWLRAQPLTGLYISSVTVTEIMYGLLRMPEGGRKLAMSQQFQQLLDQGFQQRILGFEYPAAVMAARLRPMRDGIGRPLGFADAQIAAIAQVHGYAVATRNIKDFEGCGLTLMDPFQHP
jgi:hypothetical protein